MAVEINTRGAGVSAGFHVGLADGRLAMPIVGAIVGGVGAVGAKVVGFADGAKVPKLNFALVSNTSGSTKATRDIILIFSPLSESRKKWSRLTATP